MATSVRYQKSPSTSRIPYFYGITNPEWLKLKTLYFFENGAMGAIIPYIILFYKTRGLAASQIGIIELAFTFIGSVSRPIFGSIADRTARHRVVLGICLMVFSIMFFALNFVQPSQEKPVRYQLHLTCNATTHQFKFDACKSAESVLAKMAIVQPEFLLHHIEAGFRNNCTSFGNTCQVVCRNFLSIKTQEGLGTGEEPFSSLAVRIGENASSEYVGRCSSFPITVSSSYSHVTIACNNTQEMPCEIDCGCSMNKTEIYPNSYTAEAEQLRKNADNGQIFLTVLLLRSISAIPFGPSISLADSITYDILGPRHRNLWGQQRMWGTVAWGIVALILGFLVDIFGTYNSIFYFCGMFGVAAALVAFFWLPKRLPLLSSNQISITTITTNKHSPAHVHFGAALRSVFNIPVFCIACFVAVISGMFLGVIYVVWPQLIIHDLKGKRSLIGFATLLSCSVEVPSFFFAGTVVGWLGEAVCFLLMLAAYAVRCLCYAYLTPETVWLALPLEVLHVFTFAFYWAAATRLAATVAPPGTSATVQAIIGASYFGIGLGLGNLISSLIYERFKGHVAFLIYSAFAALTFVILLVIYFAYMRRALAEIRKSHKPDRNDSFSPALNADLSWIDDDIANEQPMDTSSSSDGSKKQMGDLKPIMTDDPNFADL